MITITPLHNCTPHSQRSLISPDTASSVPASVAGRPLPVAGAEAAAGAVGVGAGILVLVGSEPSGRYQLLASAPYVDVAVVGPVVGDGGDIAAAELPVVVDDVVVVVVVVGDAAHQLACED